MNRKWARKLVSQAQVDHTVKGYVSRLSFFILFGLEEAFWGMMLLKEVRLLCDIDLGCPGRKVNPDTAAGVFMLSFERYSGPSIIDYSSKKST